eukprot:TRINITY_DN2870_c0_g1_i1.p1 TRINITY_DN2870_c0_g1~~TRINITY_DN2870_c0_g1_i1.p1  ORF type:complete len:131 (-),score=13.65 TRINITY_DN2870_c0_g1_i1:68-460(-)
MDTKTIIFDISDLECSICMETLYKPATLVCGHSFCLHCVNQILKISDRCPICRNPIINFNMKEIKTNIALQNIIERYFSEEIKEKRENEKHIQLQSFDMPKLSQLPIRENVNENQYFNFFFFSCNRWDCI